MDSSGNFPTKIAFWTGTLCVDMLSMEEPLDYTIQVFATMLFKCYFACCVLKQTHSVVNTVSHAVSVATELLF